MDKAKKDHVKWTEQMDSILLDALLEQQVIWQRHLRRMLNTAVIL